MNGLRVVLDDEGPGVERKVSHTLNAALSALSLGLMGWICMKGRGVDCGS